MAYSVTMVGNFCANFCAPHAQQPVNLIRCSTISIRVWFNFGVENVPLLFCRVDRLVLSALQKETPVHFGLTVVVVVAS